MPRTNAAFMKPVQPDAVLAAIVGAEPIPRTEITKRLWAYIKKHGLQLQSPDDRRRIFVAALLVPLCGGIDAPAHISMFDLPKFVKLHTSPAD